MVTSTRAISWRDRANIDVLDVTAYFECYEWGQIYCAAPAAVTVHRTGFGGFRLFGI
jgi:hypothetical protein